MGQAILWVLEGEAKDVIIKDLEGKKRHVDMSKVKPTIRGAYVSGGRFAKGVGTLLYGGKLGNRTELTKQGNKYTTNEQILEAIGYKKTMVEI